MREEEGNGGTTRMGLGRVKRKREKILLEKQTLTSTIGQIYRLRCYRSYCTVCGVLSIATVALHRKRKK